jgi:hypothetical protein
VPTEEADAKLAKEQEEAQFQEQRAKLLASLDSGGVDMQTLEPVDVTTGETSVEGKKRALAESSDAAPSPPGKRARLDVASTRRMVLGSLGIRATKSKSMDDKSVSRSVPADIQSADEVPPESDAWKGKLRVTAVECVLEGFTLTPPPYPFVQRWDPSQQLKSKKRKKSARKSYGQEEYDAYDESAITADPDTSEYPALNYDEDSEDKPHALSSDFTKPPEDPDTLATAMLADCTPGTIIAFKQYDLSEATGWQPVISEYRTARIDLITKEPHELGITLASRDIPFKNISYDDFGNRIPSRFDVEADEDEEGDEDDGTRIVDFNELIAPKLVAAALSAKVEAPESHIADEEVVPDAQLDVDLEDAPDTTAGAAESADSANEDGVDGAEEDVEGMDLY